VTIFFVSVDGGEKITNVRHTNARNAILNARSPGSNDFDVDISSRMYYKLPVFISSSGIGYEKAEEE